MKNLFAGLMISGMLGCMTVANALELIVPYPPGGAANLVARSIEQSHKNLIVSYRSGAGGVVGAQHVLKENSPDKLLLANPGSLVFNTVLFNDQSYSYKDFDVIAPMATSPSVLTVSDTSVKNLQDFRSLAQKKNISCGASSTSGAIAGKALLRELNITNGEMLIFKGSAEVVTALMGKHIDCSVDTLASHRAVWQNGNINVIAVGSAKPHKDLPGVPLYSSIVPGLVFDIWFGVAVPRSVDAQKRQSVLAQFSRMHQDPQFQENISKTGLDVAVPAENSQQWLQQQHDKLDDLRQSLGIKKQ